MPDWHTILHNKMNMNLIVNLGNNPKNYEIVYDFNFGGEFFIKKDTKYKCNYIG